MGGLYVEMKALNLVTINPREGIPTTLQVDQPVSTMQRHNDSCWMQETSSEQHMKYDQKDQVDLPETEVYVAVVEKPWAPPANRSAANPTLSDW